MPIDAPPTVPLDPAPAPIRILTVDDHPLLREGIAAVIEGHAGLVLVAEATRGAEAIAAYREHRPDVTLMDLQMPDMSGIDAIVEIRREFPAARIVMLTTYKGDVQAMRAFKAGAYGYLLKSMLRKELVETVLAVHAGKRRIPPEIAAEIAEHATDEWLTARETGVLKLVALGNANRDIGELLGIGEETVKTHMKSIMAKLGARDRTHAVTIALKRGIIDV